jgi:MFS family permease
MLYVGVALFWVSAVSLAWSTAATPHGWIVAVMILAGCGLGFVLPNLTLFTQHCAPRQRLGVATAMLQSSRMIGGMLGMALIGAFVSHAYARGVDSMLHAGGHEGLRGWLGDLQILVDPALEERFATALAPGGADAAALLARARGVLVDALHQSEWLIAVVVLLALYVVRRVPAVDLRRPSKARESARE